MNDDSGAVTRGEFDMLRDQVAANAVRLDVIDQSGTRGVGVVQQQITDLAKDVAQLQVKFDRHEGEHDQAERDRRAARRWSIAAAIAFLAMVEGPLGWIIVHVR